MAKKKNSRKRAAEPAAAAPIVATQMDASPAKAREGLGEFPFPLSKGPSEPATVQWLRNHSSYLTVGGFQDYFVPVAVLARGIAINFLILIPWLILVSLVLSFSHHWILNHELLLLQFAAGAAVVLILVYMVGTPLLRIWRHRRSLERGSIDNVRQRIAREQLLGVSLIVILIVAFVELSPRLIEYFRTLFGSDSFSLSQKLATVVGLSALLGSSNAILSALKGIKRTLAIVFIGLAGLIVPWMIVLYVTNYLVYSAPPREWTLGLPAYSALLLAILTIVALVMGGIRKTLSMKEAIDMLILSLSVAGVLLVTWFIWGHAVKERTRSMGQLGVLARPLARLVKTPVFAEQDTSSAAVLMGELTDRKKRMDQKFNAQPNANNMRQVRQWHREYYQGTQSFVERGEDLVALDDTSQFGLRQAIAKRDRSRLLDLADAKRAANSIRPVTGSEFRDRIIEEVVWRKVSDTLSTNASDSQVSDAQQNTNTTQQLTDESARYESIVGDQQFLDELRDIRIPPPLIAEFQDLTTRTTATPTTSVQELQQEGNIATRSDVALIPDDYSEDKLKEYRGRAIFRYLCDQHSFQSLRGVFELWVEEFDESAKTAKPAATNDQSPPAQNNASEDTNQPPTKASEPVATNKPAQADVEATNGKPETDDSKGTDSGSDPLPAPPQINWEQRLRRALIRKALEHFDVRELMYLADIEHLVYLDVPGDGNDMPPPSENRKDEITIWHAQQALTEGKSAADPHDRAITARNHLADIYTKNNPEAFVPHVRDRLIDIAMYESSDQAFWAREILGDLFNPSIPTELAQPDRIRLYRVSDGQSFNADELIRIAVAKFVDRRSERPDLLAARVGSGEFGFLQGLSNLDERLFWYAIWPKLLLVLSWALVLGLLCWLAADININSLHGYYRDRLARAFLIRKTEAGSVEVEEDISLASLSDHQARSVAPYHLINVALNLQGSKDIALRDRQSDFFILSKRFVGGERTGYCRTATLAQVFPQVSLSTAMAISAGAASPNMGRITNPFLVLFMTLLNVRMGYWIPNPGLLEETQNDKRWQNKKKAQQPNSSYGFSFDKIFRQELVEVQARWQEAYDDPTVREFQTDPQRPSIGYGLVGIGFSGGGIRSATVNLGILQVLDARGVFQHADYLSTVSGGGYLGSSISALMRVRTTVFSQNDGAVSVEQDSASNDKVVVIEGNTSRRYRFSDDAELAVRDGENVGVGRRLIRAIDAGVHAEFDGTVKVLENPQTNEQIVTVTEDVESNARSFEYTFTEFDPVIVQTGDAVTEGQPLVARRSSLAQRFLWGVPPRFLYREMLGFLHEKSMWVNLSDGGHIENLAAMELLRRRCKFMIIGDGEADPNHTFNGFATLLRFARIDLGIEIEINLDDVRKDPTTGCAKSHWAIGKITYPPHDTESENAEIGYLLYLKSSVTGDEGELINEYRNNFADFPHQSTADQFFNEGQFEAYRALGQHIAETMLSDAGVAGEVEYASLEPLCQTLWSKRKKQRK